MKNMFTLGRRHGSAAWEVVLDSTAQQRDHRSLSKPYRASKKHPKWAELHTVKTTRKFRFDPVATPKAVVAPPPKSIVQKVVTALTPKRAPARKPSAFSKRVVAVPAQ